MEHHFFFVQQTAILGFNPSCGLIGCGTEIVRNGIIKAGEFQSLVRVDWLWNSKCGPIQTAQPGGFNPSCGLIGCGTGCGTAATESSGRFQSLVRVDWLWNWTCPTRPARRLPFQSLVRVDWLWNLRGGQPGQVLREVSIPRAG